jgi:hypothetical protein
MAGRRVAGVRAPAAVLVLVGVLTAACTTGHTSAGPRSSPPASPPASRPPTSAPAASGSAGPASSSPPTSMSSSPAPSVSTVPTPSTLVGAPGTVVVGGATPSRMSISVSRALFTSAPTVVVASPAAATDIASGAKVAEQAGVPLLLLDRADKTPTGAIPTATLFAAELQRLGTTSVVAIGASAADVAAVAPPGVDVVAAADDAQPATSENGADLTVLVAAGANATSDAIAADATASATAAGATVVSVHGTDPRRDPAAIAALAGSPPQKVLAVGTQFGTPETVAARVAVASTGTELPGGGQIFFPGRRLVALYGHPGTAALGVLGAQDLAASIVRAKQLAATYAPLSSVPVIPTFEIIATVAQAAAGSDGNYSGESSVAALLPWVQQANAAGLYVVLDLQPGSANVLSQAKLYTQLLAMPDVGLAIDPEWALGPGQQPLQQIGSINAVQINAVGAWLEALTASKHLPQKLLVLHQFRLSMIGDESALKTNYDDVAVLIHMDGQGKTANKIATWTAVVHAAPKGVPFGWKNFYVEDHPTMTPQQTMAQKPTPVMISYQ